MNAERRPNTTLLITTKNRPNNIDSLLGSLQGYGYLQKPNLQIVVVDSSASEETQKIALSYPSVDHLPAPDMGKSTAMNFAIDTLSTKYVAFIDDDIVVINSFWLDQLTTNFTRENIAYVSGRVVAFKPQTVAQTTWEQKGALNKGPKRIEVGKDFFQGFRLCGVPIQLVTMGANHMVKREVLLEIEAHDERFGPGEVIGGAGADLDLTYKILKRGYDIIYDPTAVVAHRHPETLKELKSKLFVYGISDTAIHTKFLVEFGDIRSFFQLVYRPGQNFSRLVKSLAGKYPLPPSLLLAGIAGNLIGPLMYMKYRKLPSKTHRK